MPLRRTALLLLTILSTSRGVMTGKQARQQGVGGEVRSKC